MSARKMRVISCDQIRTGESNGREWTLYKVTAVTPEGEPIDAELKSFAFLTGEVEVEVEKQESPKYGTSYLLKLPRDKRSNGGGGGGGNQLAGRVDMLEESVRLLIGRVASMEAAIAGQRPLAEVAPTQEPVYTHDPDDDPPF